MAEATLIAARGARRVSRDELMKIDTPPVVGRHHPIAHWQVVEACEKTLDEAGFGTTSAEFAVGKENNQLFATFTLANRIGGTAALAVGLRSSFDKSLPLGLVAGSRVFVCSNLCFRSDLINVRRLHTKHGGERFSIDLKNAISSLPAFQEAEEQRLQNMRATFLSDTEAEALMLRACIDKKILPLKSLPSLVNNWRNPTHAEFEPRTVWSLLNAFTGVLGKYQVRNPSDHSIRTMRLNRLISPLRQLQLAEEPESHPLAV